MATGYATVVQNWTINLEQAPSPYTLPVDFSNQIPNAIGYAESRIYAQMVFLAERTSNASLAFTTGSRTLDMSAMTPKPLVIEGVAAITPIGTANPKNGKRWQYHVTSLDTIDDIWPQEAQTLSPSNSDQLFWAMKDAYTIVVAPTPDQAYQVELTGIWQPAPLNSTTNTDTYLTNVYMPLFAAAGMVWWCGYMRDYGQMADDDSWAMSWERLTQQLLTVAVDEENRRRGLSPLDGSAIRKAPPPVQGPQR